MIRVTIRDDRQGRSYGIATIFAAIPSSNLPFLYFKKWKGRGIWRGRRRVTLERRYCIKVSIDLRYSVTEEKKTTDDDDDDIMGVGGMEQEASLRRAKAGEGREKRCNKASRERSTHRGGNGHRYSYGLLRFQGVGKIGLLTQYSSSTRRRFVIRTRRNRVIAFPWPSLALARLRNESSSPGIN